MNKYISKITTLLSTVIYMYLFPRGLSNSVFFDTVTFFSKKKASKGMDAMILGLVVTLIIFFISVYCVLSAMGIFGPEAQTFITRLSFGLGEATPSFG